MKPREPHESENLTAEELETIEALLNYPSLGKVFDPANPRNPAAVRQKMQATIDDLERVIRRGSKIDADKAARAVEAYRTAIRFLEELENARQG